MKSLKVLCGATLIMLGLNGCAQMMEPEPDDPNFAPAMPEEQVVDVVPDGSIFANSRVDSIYTDIKAPRVGDIISVQLEESTSASKNTSNNSSKEGSTNLTPLSLGGHPVSIHGYSTQAGMSSDQSFKGQAKASQSNSLRGNISVSVVKVLANGGLVVRGEKWVMLTNGNEYIRITGIVRSEDVNADNTVSSQKIANARIQYGGTGDFANAAEKGWLTRFFNSKWMPF